MNASQLKRRSNNDANRIEPEDRGVHEWYRFVLSFPPHLVRDYLGRFELDPNHCVLDPFCGTGTTLVECKKLGIPSIGIEANAMAHFACRVKLDWSARSKELISTAEDIGDRVLAKMRRDGLPDELGPLFERATSHNGHSIRGLKTLNAEQHRLLLANSISPLPLHRTLVLLDTIEKYAPERVRDHLCLALAKTVVFSISNLHFGPEVGVTTPKSDASVVKPWLEEVHQMSDDLSEVRKRQSARSEVYHGDAREIARWLQPSSIDAVITSPPYPNEKDYTRTTRLESVLLGFLRDKASLRQLKQGLLRSNTRNVYKHDDDDRWIADHPEIRRIAQAIEKRRIELGKTSGFERLYHRVTKLYFGGMARHLAALRPLLRPGAKLAYVVGDQASYLRVMIRTGDLLADIAKSLGYRVLSIDLFRTRLATATRAQLREEVVCLVWNG
jgi:DNA modification methylase